MNTDWNLEDFSPFFIKWAIYNSSEIEGKSIICNLFVNEHPHQYCQLSKINKECSFELQYLDSSAKGKLNFIEAKGKLYLGIDIRYGLQDNLKTVKYDILPGPDKSIVSSEPSEPYDAFESASEVVFVNSGERQYLFSEPSESCDAFESASETVFVNSGEHQDLFPFVYMRTWTEISPDVQQRRFIEYDSENAPSESLYKKLVEIKKASENNARLQMRQVAINFIEGKQFAEQFIPSNSNLNGYIKYFALLDTWLRHQTSFSCKQLKQQLEVILKLDWSNLKQYIQSQKYIQEKDRVWQNYFALTIISEYRPHLLEELTKTLVMLVLIEKIIKHDKNCHSGSAITENVVILETAISTIILPTEIFPLPSASAGKSKITEWIEPYAIGDLQMVCQRLLRYELGEVAYIENVLKGERKETTQRKLNRVNQSVTNSSEKLEEIADGIDDTRADILNETQKTLAKDAVTTTFNSLSTEYGITPSTVKVTGGWTISNAPDSTQPYREDVNKFAKNITTRTANRIARYGIARYVNQVRTIILDETQETVIHAFDNKNSTSNVIGIYRWVNQIYTAHVVNYGQRLMLEFMLENPADSYINSLLHLQGISLDKPIAPDKLNLHSYKAITRENYADLAIKYQVKDIQTPPDAVKIVPTAFKDKEPNSIKKIQIPEGYRATSADVAGVFSGVTALTGFIGIQILDLTTSPRHICKLGMNQEDTAIAASVLCDSDKDKSDAKYSVSIEVTCTLAPEKFAEWQINIYNAILEGYRQQQAEYYERAGVGLAEIKSHNPLKYRQIEKHELKKACTRQIIKRHFQLVGSSDDNSVKNQPSNFAVNEPRYIQFFEQSLEWNEITYNFYPQLEEGENQDEFTFTAFNPYSGNDSLFTSFLQAGAVRVLVPVRPDYAMLVLYYLSSGTIWTGANALTPTDEKYVSLVNDLKILPQSDRESKHVSEPWEITIPTSMIMLQDSSKLPQF
ncbi:hypothetical protein Cylst_2394 [Cylindrospermum stagnale PCC 7417]|uniref:Uncharacterized protein n=1 Tax=Cylindrospermum stagnale PCC 7417 TaxID=56107 RepID=K9WWP9_9NOST|nr:hypothetical protein [Cylindrospermum stagnale]AFZ24613.1 hypothetical protein Cylst_2394 [Cylindrospermum stagnale PCC 7417]